MMFKVEQLKHSAESKLHCVRNVALAAATRGGYCQAPRLPLRQRPQPLHHDDTSHGSYLLKASAVATPRMSASPCSPLRTPSPVLLRQLQSAHQDDTSNTPFPPVKAFAVSGQQSAALMTSSPVRFRQLQPIHQYDTPFASFPGKASAVSRQRSSVSPRPRPRAISPAGSQTSLCSTTASADDSASSRSSSLQVAPQKSGLAHPTELSRHLERPNRHYRRVLVIECGFGTRMNPMQTQIIIDAGFQVRWVDNLPNPERAGFDMVHHFGFLQRAIDEFQPHLLMCASKGGPYMIAAWETGLWTGPSLMINRHPSLQRLPPNVRIVICQGSNDEVYSVHSRDELECLVSSCSPNQTLLYYTCDGVNACGNVCRQGDNHNQVSLLHYDCLPRLMDAALAQHESPDVQLMRSWTDLAFVPERLQAESFLGYMPDALFRFWASLGQRGEDCSALFPVAPSSQEFAMVSMLFGTNPKVPSAYPGYRAHGRIHSIDRVENGSCACNFHSYCTALRVAIEKQGIAFEAGLHMRWGFHGSDAQAITSIVSEGFRPASNRQAWGPGTYFARDANYCFQYFCKGHGDGTKKLLVCLLGSGMPCLGNCNNEMGALPTRQGRQEYNSSVDSISNPEIYIMQQDAAYPAYVVTFSE